MWLSYLLIAIDQQKDQSYIAKILKKIRQSDLLIAINQQEEQMELDHIYIAKCVDRQKNIKWTDKD